MKLKISIICLLLISVYCLSAVCAADLNQTVDDIKTNDANDDRVILVDGDGHVSVYDENNVENKDAKWVRVNPEDEDNEPIDEVVLSTDDAVSFPAFPEKFDSGILFPCPGKDMPILKQDSSRDFGPSASHEPISVNLDVNLDVGLESVHSGWLAL